jgi:hypothetical protein
VKASVFSVRSPRIAGPAFVAAFALGVFAIDGSAQQLDNGGVAAAARATDHAVVPMSTTARRAGAINVDGVLGDEGWRGAPMVATDFTQWEPREGDPSTERTEVYLVYDDEAIYVSARLWDTTGDIRKRLARRDSFLMDSDWFNVALDTHHGHLTAYQFTVNPAGVKRDEITNGRMMMGMGDASWDAVWDGKASIDAEGWSVEMRIPFSQLRFSSADAQTWGVQFQRRINRLQELSVFSFTPRGQPTGVARYAHIDGLQGLQTGKRLEAMPYALGRASFAEIPAGDPFRDGSVYGQGYGLDALYRLTTSMTLNATVNPDFGQVEVDPAVVNLTAFETSFQERRPFFVEGATLFRFGVSAGPMPMGPGGGGGGGAGGAGGGGGGGAAGGGGGGGAGGTQLVYSRRIGRAPQGLLPSDVSFSETPETATILGAAKITGRTATGWSLGLLDAVTDRETARWMNEDGELGETLVEPTTNYLVARALKDMRSGQTQLGILGTAVNRRLDDDNLTALLRSHAYTGGIDFSQEFAQRAWSIEGTFAASHVEGSIDAMLRTQRQSSRYFQRPDAGHVEIDSTMTSMQGYTTRLELGKRAGLHWRGEASVTATSPGFEINDMGFQTGVDRITPNMNITYMQSTPQGWFRNYRINGGPMVNWNYDGDFVGGRVNLNLNGQLTNFWGGGIMMNRRLVGYDDRLTRGGPLMKDRAGQSIGFNINSDQRKEITARLNGNYSWGEGEGLERRIGGNIQLRPVESWTISFGPSFSRNLIYAQYVTTITDSTATATFGRRYIFTGLEQTSVSMETRLNVNFTPELSLELFAQPLISSADYGALRELRAPRTYDFSEYGKDNGSTIAYDEAARLFTIDPDGSGRAPTFTLRNRDFNQLSLRGNAVLRWEYRPGSTLFLVWQQSRGDTRDFGDFDFGRDAGQLFDARPDNFFVIKLNYWLNL